MEYQIDLAGAKPDLGAAQQTLHAIDPAALMAVDFSGRQLRVATVLSAEDLRATLRRAGLEVRDGDLQRLPSTCCGGCGG
jgi:hypothetical protein